MTASGRCSTSEYNLLHLFMHPGKCIIHLIAQHNAGPILLPTAYFVTAVQITRAC